MRRSTALPVLHRKGPAGKLKYSLATWPTFMKPIFKCTWSRPRPNVDVTAVEVALENVVQREVGKSQGRILTELGALRREVGILVQAQNNYHNQVQRLMHSHFPTSYGGAGYHGLQHSDTTLTNQSRVNNGMITIGQSVSEWP